MQIGEFTRTSSGFVGSIRTINLDLELTLVPAEANETDGAPNYRIHLGADGDGPEIGAGWDRSGERAGPYVAVQLDCPTFVQPLRANLFRSGADESAHHLVWNRPSKREGGSAKSDERS
ncbi:DUF736 domain-containing protein [Sphingomonas sp. TX0522]|uniref:DUF736 domain-containing protein n=1 Tax=Sphingomonas sp. TX0522 TaxID=2479205 RepID=UPI001E6461F6|nr:DUF736 domain-containing protein [Sphingomonas sp. TX0522]